VFRHFLILLILVTPCIQSCAYRPAIDNQGNVTSRTPNKFMRNYGIREFERLKRQKKTTRDPRYTKPLQRVAKRLQKVIDMPDAEWEFVIFKDRAPNAFALPGGKVGVNTGLFRITGKGKKGDAMLAAVLGHEISHATSNHAGQRMKRAIGLTLATSLLWYGLDQNGTNKPELAALSLASTAYFIDSLPFSRKQEYESDRIGAVYMAKAGYNPRLSIELWRRMQAYHLLHGKQKPEFLRTHPRDDTRISALEAFMPTAMKFYHKQRE